MSGQDDVTAKVQCSCKEVNKTLTWLTMLEPSHGPCSARNPPTTIATLVNSPGMPGCQSDVYEDTRAQMFTRETGGKSFQQVNCPDEKGARKYGPVKKITAAFKKKKQDQEPGKQCASAMGCQGSWKQRIQSEAIARYRKRSNTIAHILNETKL